MKKKLHTSILLVVFSLCNTLVHAVSNPNFNVAPNGVTCLCPDAAIGETGELTINGVTQTYTKRTRQQLLDLINANQNDPQIALTCTSGITDMNNLFSQKSAFNQDISTWDVSNVTNMINLFLLASNFNQPLNDWDVSNVTTMQGLFSAASSFNQPLNNWDVSNVTNMKSTFDNAASFNQSLNDWDVSSVTQMDFMFAGASSFNQPLNNWDVSNVTNMSSMFLFAFDFNQPLNSWDVSSVTNMFEMFRNASSFNQDISSWCVEQIASMPSNFSINSPLQASFRPNWGVACFYVGDNGVTCFCPNNDFGDTGTLTINGVTQTYTKRSRQQLLDLINANQNDPQIALTCTSGVTDMNNLFSNKSSFNQDVSTWDVSNVTTMNGMFASASSFNQPLNNWDVSNVIFMTSMFSGASSFNQPLNDWDVSNVTNMEGLFSSASSFNQDISSWCVEQIASAPSNFSINSPLQASFQPNWGVSCTFFVGQNGVTCFCPDVAFGQSAELTINGITQTYTKRTRQQLLDLIDANQNDPQIALTCTSGITDMSNLFSNKSSFNQDISTWDVSNVTNMGDLFLLASSFNQPLNDWDVSNVTNMRRTFWGASAFNQPLNNWDVSSVTNMAEMFRGANDFNADIGDWNVGNVELMIYMFMDAESFNQDIGSWNVANVTNMTQMFRNASSFNQDIGGWDTSSLNFATGMFLDASSFNQDLNNWDVSGINSLSIMFSGATAFNGNISSWNVGNVNNMVGVFKNATNFNQDISDWDVSNVTNMYEMFRGASSFNADISSWDVSNLNNLSFAFVEASSFNQDISGWNVSNVTTLSGTFYGASSFNQDIGSWNVSNVSDMRSTFHFATSFDQDLGNWDISSILPFPNGNNGSMRDMFTGTALSGSNYDNTLIGWSTLDTNETQVPQNVTFSGGNSKYCLSENARTNLINNFNWTITDGGLNTGCSLPTLISSTPQANTTNIAFDANLVLTFDAPIIGSLVNPNNILVLGNQTGIISGTFSGSGTNEITFDPTNNFKPGELITVSITAGLAITNPIVFSFTATVSPTSPGAFVNGQNVITADAVGARSVFVADIDGDGDLDILSASENDDKIAWYENDGLGNFGTQKIISTSAGGAYSVYAADIDGDGDLDLLSATFNDNNIIWYENDGNGNFGTPQIISTLVSGVRSVYAIDLDGDGDIDVLSASQNDDKIAWYENDGNGNFSTQQVISTLADGALSVYAADIDGDGDMDILSASFFDDTIAWYENDGNGNFGTKQIISTLVNVASSVYAADIDGDGDLDVLSASFEDDEIAWFENDGNGNFGTQQIISNLADGATSVYAADIDGDGDVDVLSASRFDNKIAWYENDGNGNFGTQQIISNLADGAQSVYAADIDGDGDLDVISASFDNDEIAWYENGAFLRTNWTGNVDEDWENNLNWNKGIPDSEAIAIVEDISLNTPIINPFTSAETHQLLIGNTGAINVHGVLKVVDKIKNNGMLNFISDDIKTGQLDTFTGTYSGTGNVQTERFIPAGDNERRAFRFLSSSINSTESIRANWQEGVNNTGTSFPTDNQNPNPGFGTHISGSLTGDNGFDATGSGAASLFLYPNNSQTWVPIANTDVNTLAAGAAYRLMVRGDRSINLTTNGADPSNTKLRATGNLVFGQVDMSANLAQGADEFSFVGNPYQAVVDFSTVTKTNLRDYLYIWDASLTGENGRGTYVVVEVPSNGIVAAPAASSSTATKFIAPQQAFFVRNTSAGNPTLVFEETDKATTQAQVEVFSTYSNFYINSRLYKTADLQSGNSELDAIALRFGENYTTLADEEDAEKLGNTNENFAIINQGLRAIDKQNIPTNGHEVALFVNNYTDTDYSFTFDLENTPEGQIVWLEDQFLGTSTPVSAGSVYAFSVDASIPASMAFSRFKLVFDMETFSNADFEQSALSIYPNPTEEQFYISGLTSTAEVHMYDVLGKEVLAKDQVSNQEGIHIESLPSGVYVVKVIQGEMSFSTKLIVK